MFSIRIVSALLLCVVLSACGGAGGDGGGGDDTSISLSTSTLSFSGDVNGQSPPQQTVTVNFQGAGVVIGTLPGQPTVPPWLAVGVNSQPSATQAIVGITVFPTNAAQGQHSFTLRFVTGRADQTHLKTADLVVNLRINRPFSANTVEPLSFTQIDGAASATANGAATIAIGGDDISWRAVADQPWIVLGAASGTQATNLSVGINRQALNIGSYTGQIQITDDRRNRTVTLPISFEIRPAHLTVGSGTLSFAVDRQTPANALEQALLVSDELNGQNVAKSATWTATIADPWLEMSSTAGSTAPSQQLAVRLDDDALNVMDSGSYDTQIEFAYQDSAGGTHTLTVPVSLNVRLPLARAATPYVLAPGVATTLRLRGQNIRPEDMADLQLSGGNFTATRVDASHLTVDVPALAPGEYTFSFTNAAGLSRSAATLVVKQAAAMGAGVIEAPNLKRLLLDEQRGRLLVIDRTQSQIKPYQWNTAISQWSALSPLPIAELADAALTRDGKSLIIAARNAIYYADANDMTQPLQTIWERPPPDTSYPPALNAIQVNDLGAAMIVETLHFAHVSGSSPALVFDTVRRTAPTPLPGFDLRNDAQLAQSPGGRYMMYGDVGVFPPSPSVQFDSFAEGETLLGARRFAGSGGFATLQISAADNRILLGHTEILDIDGTKLGTLPDNNDFFFRDFAVISPDGTRGYRLRYDLSAAGDVEVIDLTAPSAPDYPALGTIALPSRIADPQNSFGLSQATSLAQGLTSSDGRLLFLSGQERIVVIDVSGL